MKQMVLRVLRFLRCWKRAVVAKNIKVSRKIRVQNLNIIYGKILVLVPHADDELIGCHQFMNAHRENVVLFYCGFLGSNFSKENGMKRLQEFQHYCQFAHLDYIQSGTNVYGDLCRAIESLKPTTILLPSIVDWHSEHRILNTYLTKYITENSACIINTIVWYHISVPLYAARANAYSFMNKDEQELKWETFNNMYPSQRNIDVDRFMFAERDCVEGQYAAETYYLMNREDFVAKMYVVQNISMQFDNLKALLQDYHELVIWADKYYSSIEL